jgi:hypothetical protein
MIDLSVCTDILKLKKASAIVDLCGSLKTWEDVMGGEVGIVVDEVSEKYHVEADLLKQMQLPNVAKFQFCGKSADIGEQEMQLLGGDDYVLPVDVGYSWIYLHAFVEGVKVLSFKLEIDNSKHIQNLIRSEYPNIGFGCKEMGMIYLSIPLPSEFASVSNARDIDRKLLIDEFNRLADLLKCIGLDCVNSEDFVNARSSIDMPRKSGVLSSSLTCHKDQLCFNFRYATSVHPEWRYLHHKVQAWMRQKKFTIAATLLLDFGGMNWFAGYTGCVTPQAYEIIQREAANPQFITYSGRYMKLEQETWVSREKRRKKLTAPIFQQLGTGTLENGVNFVLRLKIVKEGYIIYLDFPTDEDMTNFEQTELFGMTKWNYNLE